MYKKAGLLIILVFVLFSACKKYETDTITGNVPPPDPTINNVTVGNYVNKVYISVLGRKPDSLELNSGIAILKKNNLSTANRTQFLDSVFNHPEYYDHLYNTALTDLLNNLDSNEIINDIGIFQSLLLDSAYILSWNEIRYEIVRLDSMRTIPNELKSGAINTIEMQKRCINNYYYDQINMGAANFVISSFLHFLNRAPTTNELTQGEDMVNGMPGTLFLQVGQSKPDYLVIFFSSLNYFEGEAVLLYNKYLFRNPTSIEMSNAATKYQGSLDYIQMQKDILSTNEYIGI